MGFLAPPGTDPESDVVSWVARADRGEPYDDQGAKDIVDKLSRFHSAYGIDSSHPPPPLFVASGFTDDLFPVDEALRFANRTRREHPKVPVSLMFGDFGHQRAANKPVDRKRLLDAIHAWFDHYLRGRSKPPRRGVVATTQTCPRDVRSGGPFRAATFAGLARGEVRIVDSTMHSISSNPGDPAVGLAIDPVTGGGDGCKTTGTGPEPGAAAWSLPPAAGRGYTLLGAPTVIARLGVSGSAAQIAARLWDVAPDGQSQTLVARGLYRPKGSGREVWQLHANGWLFEAGHVAKLQLLGADPPYARPSSGSFTVAVKRLELRLPVREKPGRAPRGAIRPPARVVLPPGQS
jgi:hypothetical protein